jgi:nitroreductase
MILRKPAETSEPVHELIRERWSPRAFLDRPVPQELLTSVFEAARWAPSCNNSQPWRYIVATSDDREAYETAQSCVAADNVSEAEAVALERVKKMQPFRRYLLAAIAKHSEADPRAQCADDRRIRVRPSSVEYLKVSGDAERRENLKFVKQLTPLFAVIDEKVET